MHVFQGADAIPPSARGAVLAIGNFDGVHRGHLALIEKVKSIAASGGGMAGIMVFEPHPRMFFAPDSQPAPLTPLPEKLRIFEELGIEMVIVMPFDARLAALPAERFIEDILVSALGVRHVVIGYDFFFGQQRGGKPATMLAAGQRLGFGVRIVEPVAEGGEVFSSTEIRLKLARGDVAGAAAEMGRRWRVTGRVVGGAKLGTGLGFPTANLPMPPKTALGHGIYAVRAIVDGTAHDGAAYLGTRPTFDDGSPVLEVFLLDFDGDLYGRDMTVEFIAFIRPDRKFDTAADLVLQMKKDIAEVRRVLREAAAET